MPRARIISPILTYSIVADLVDAASFAFEPVATARCDASAGAATGNLAGRDLVRGFGIERTIRETELGRAAHDKTRAAINPTLSHCGKGGHAASRANYALAKIAVRFRLSRP